jgi:hypothetical protein
MPKLSLYRPNKQNDYRFFDRTISEELRVGGTDLYIHKYLGPTNQGPSIDYTQPEYDSLNPLNIQDLLFFVYDSHGTLLCLFDMAFNKIDLVNYNNFLFHNNHNELA